MNNLEDYWSSEDFENTVSSALISCYESKVIKNKGAAPSDRLKDEHLKLIRNEGPYINSNSRIIISPLSEDDNWEVDIKNDELPIRGCFAFIPSSKFKDLSGRYESYLMIIYIHQVDKLGRYWHKRKGGTLFEMFSMSAELNGGIDGERRFVTVTKEGHVISCTQKIETNDFQFGYKNKIIEPDSEWLDQTSTWASVALQILADKRHCWTITAKEKNAKAHLGCMKEEIKSLLYARNLPLTSTGRKRPILHLVESHKRRIKNGIDIDITKYLRGIQDIEIGGTVFSVKPPKVLYPLLSKQSQNKFYNNII